MEERRGDDGGRSIALAVEPHLLQDLLERLLRANGWTVGTWERADVVVRSQNVAIEIEDGAALTVVLPDETTSGEVRWAGHPPESLPPGAGPLEAVLGVLGPA